jgi:small-conductance mechanosensitive channel
MARELFDNLAHGRRPWQKRIRRIFGISAQEKIPGLSWLEILVNFAIWGLFAYVLLHIWGLSDTVWHQVKTYLYEGFLIGSLKIIPAKLILALLAFVVLLVVSGWFRNHLEKRWLSQTRIERGAREAIVTISGYTGVAVAILVALGITGVEFTNLAIIAGALSVGIGFGLQNIVNNFVSGLILLFERPVKTGDWIVVGNTEGYVKRIRIRSTQIQTFDRADVIVPNSELISSQVINWMLYDERGRLRVPVGVAYGSNTQLVKEVLLKVANEHPDVIKDDEDTAPRVLFLAFGDSSLNFELRVHIQNINKRLSVLSDMNFAIDAAFRENGIEIPFPQRDLHVKNWPPQRPADAGTSDE